MKTPEKKHEQINYLELPASDIAANKAFFSAVFAWQFVDYGDDYVAFVSPTIEGGFFRCDKKVAQASGSVLIVFYSTDLRKTAQKINQAGGRIIKETYRFPGGERFHFVDPSGNEYAVWGAV